MGRNGQHYMTEKERCQLEAYLQAGKPKTWIARIMGFCRQTIYNEIDRGKVNLVRGSHGIWRDTVEYSADKAQQIHDYNQTAKGRPIKLGNHHDYARRLESLMLGVQPDGTIDRRKRYSPYAALAIAGKEGYQISVCTATLYSYIGKGVFLHLTNKDLWQKWKRKKRRYRPVQRVAHAHLPSIEARPQIINDRAELGHWEMDLVVGKNKKGAAALLTMTERQSRQEIILKVQDKKAASIITALSRIDPREIRSITTDNGSEFLHYEDVHALDHVTIATLKLALAESDHFHVFLPPTKFVAERRGYPLLMLGDSRPRAPEPMLTFMTQCSHTPKAIYISATGE